MLAQNKLSFAILLFLIIFSVIHYLKPALIYNEQGGFRHFGLGYKQKTVIPIWIVSIVLAIMCYLMVYYASL
jgi:hypothetical protein